MKASFKLNSHEVTVGLRKNKGRWSAEVQCPLCNKQYKCSDGRTPTSARYRVRDTLKCHMRRKHNG